MSTGLPHRYTAPPRLAAGDWALTGAWTVQPDAVQLDEPGGRLSCRFTARDVNLVVAPPANLAPVGFTVRLDGQRPGPDAGDDLDQNGTGSLSEPRLYQLVRQTRPITGRTVEITFLERGVRAYAFTFG